MFFFPCQPYFWLTQSDNNTLYLQVIPGQHPSSEGKRRRNRSNVEAMAAKHLDHEDKGWSYFVQ